MATVIAVGGSGTANTASLAAGQAGNGQATNIVDRGLRVDHTAPALLKITTAVGLTPTCTYLIEGSADGANWFPLPWIDTAAAIAGSVATFLLTAAGTVYRTIPAGYPWRYLRVTFSINTNTTNTVDIWVF